MSPTSRTAETTLQAHQASASLPSGGFLRYHPPQRLGCRPVFSTTFVNRSELRKEKHASRSEFPAAFFGPPLVAVLREQVPDVEVEGHLVSGGLLGSLLLDPEERDFYPLRDKGVDTTPDTTQSATRSNCPQPPARR
jgi:hypothetical protein